MDSEVRKGLRALMFLGPEDIAGMMDHTQIDDLSNKLKEALPISLKASLPADLTTVSYLDDTCLYLKRINAMNGAYNMTYCGLKYFTSRSFNIHKITIGFRTNQVNCLKCLCLKNEELKDGQQQSV